MNVQKNACALVIGLVASGSSSIQESAFDLERALELAVDLPTAPERRAAARELASRNPASLDDWLSAMADFGRFEAVEPGTLHQRAELNPERREVTELWLHVPRTYDPGRPTALLVALHGSGEDARAAVQRWSDVAERAGMLVLAPSVSDPEVGAKLDGDERELVLAALRWMRRRYNVDENRIHLTGVSRGGHTAWDLALRLPDRFASLVPMIGGPRIENGEGRNNLRYLENLAELPILDLQGARDDPLLVFNVRLAFRRLSAWGATRARLIEFPELGHDFEFDAVDWVAFFASALRDPHRSRVVRSAVRPEEGRSAWVEILALDKEVREVFEPRVDVASWNRLSTEARQERFQELIDARTARVEVVREQLGVYRVTREGVDRLRLLLTHEEWTAEPKLRIHFEDKQKTVRARADPRVLLEEFVERFDRTYLPVAEVHLR